MWGSSCPTPNSTNAGNVYNVNTSGELNNNNANNNNGVVPDWVVLPKRIMQGTAIPTLRGENKSGDAIYSLIIAIHTDQ